MDKAYSVPLWRHPTRADVVILEEQRDKAYEDVSASWECVNMGRDAVALILGEDAAGIAPMFLPEAIRTACYRAATGKLRDEVMPPDAASRRVAALELALAQYGTHIPGCQISAETPCSCGLDAARKPA